MPHLGPVFSFWPTGLIKTLVLVGLLITCLYLSKSLVSWTVDPLRMGVYVRSILVFSGFTTFSFMMYCSWSDSEETGISGTPLLAIICRATISF